MIFLRLVLAASVAGLSTFGCDEDDDNKSAAGREGGHVHGFSPP